MLAKWPLLDKGKKKPDISRATKGVQEVERVKR